MTALMAELKKDLRLYSLIMVAIGSCIGSGIFLTPSQIAGHLPAPLLILLAWGLGGVITLTGALTFAELGANAALSIACAYYIAFLFPLNETGIKIVAVLALVVVTFVNIFRVRAAEVFTNVFTGIKLVGIAALIGIGLFFGNVKFNLFESSMKSDTGSLMGAFGLALIGVLWSYGGWQHASFVAGEARDARRNIPRAMIIGSIVVTVVYLLTNLAYLFLLPVSQIASSQSIAADAIRTLIPFGGTLIAVLIAISTFGTLGIYTLSAPRIYYAMSKDGLFFKKLAWVHPKFRTPIYAILVQSTWPVPTKRSVTL